MSELIRSKRFWCGYVVGITVCLIGLLIGMLAANITDEQQGTEAFILPSIRQIQQQINDMGYPIKVDGKLGPETQEAWQKARADQTMLQMLEKGGMK